MRYMLMFLSMFLFVACDNSTYITCSLACEEMQTEMVECHTEYSALAGENVSCVCRTPGGSLQAIKTVEVNNQQFEVICGRWCNERTNE